MLKVSYKTVYIVLYVLIIKVSICIGTKLEGSIYSKVVISGGQNHGTLFFSLCLCLFSTLKKYIYLVNLVFYDPHLQSDGLLIIPPKYHDLSLLHTFAYIDPPTQNSPFSSRESFSLSISVKASLPTLIFSHHFFLWTFVIAHLVALYATYQGHELSPLILKPPQETYIIISISLMSLLCDPE